MTQFEWDPHFPTEQPIDGCECRYCRKLRNPWHPTCTTCGKPIETDFLYIVVGTNLAYHLECVPETYGKNSDRPTQ